MNDLDLYLHVREKEGRIYPDDIAVRLPEFPAEHPLKSEWLMRVDSSNRLKRYLSNLAKPLSVLEVGCGNGWLSHQIASIRGVDVWGLDRGGFELSQAVRLFNSKNLHFLIADIFHPPFPEHSFDAIILASVIQYFPDLPALIRTLRRLINQNGEIHLLDSPLYDEREVRQACARTSAYYTELGLPDMADRYFHHTVTALNEFSPRWFYRPTRLTGRIKRVLGQHPSPFPWVCIHY